MKDWLLKENKLYKEFKFKNYSSALGFVNRLSELAEAADHHPDICFGWGYVNIRLFSHDVDAVTERDESLPSQSIWSFSL